MKQARNVYAVLTRRAWLQRTFRLSGDVEALVDYDGRGVGVSGEFGWGERIRVDGRRVRPGVAVIGGRPLETMPRMADPEALRPTTRREPVWEPHRLVVQLGRGRGRIEIEVRFTRLGIVQLGNFRLTLGSEVLYEETDGRLLSIRLPPPLPVPAHAPSPDPETLPVVADRRRQDRDPSEPNQ